MRRVLLTLTLLSALAGCAVSDEQWHRALRSMPDYSERNLGIQRTETVCVTVRPGVMSCH